MHWIGKQYGQMEKIWSSSSRRKKKLIYIGIYSVVFLLAFLIAYSPLIVANKTLIMPSDGRTQHYPLMVYVGRSIRGLVLNTFKGDFSIPLFDLNSGLGEDIIGLLNSLGRTDPLILLSAFVPTKYSEFLYCFLTILRIYLAGLSFSFLCRYFKKRTSYTLIGSIIYCFSAYALYCSRAHPYFINPMILLPLLIVGIDKIIKKDKPYLLIFAVFYSALYGFYHVYMMTIMIGVYTLVRFFELYKKERINEFFRLVRHGFLGYSLGIGLAAIIFFPAVLSFLGGDRSGFSNYNAAPYTWAYFRNHLLRLVAPSTGSGWAYPSFAAIALFALLLLLFSKRRGALKILTIVTFSVWLISLGGLIMNGFQYASARWTFGLTLLMSYIVVEMLPDLLRLAPKQRIACIIMVCVYGAIVFSTASARKLAYVLVGFSFLSLTLLVLTIVLGQSDGSQNTAGMLQAYAYAKIRSVACLILIIFNVGVTGIYMYAPDQANIIGSHKEFGYEVERLENAIERELEPYMLTQPDGRADSTSFTRNTAIVWRIPGMINYSSIINGSITEFWKQVENCGAEQEFNIHTTDQRTILNTLLSEKYHIETEKNVGYVPYGYTPIKQADDNIYIFENRYALPWGYTYDAVISYNDLNGMNGVQKQEAMLQAIALEDCTIENSSLDRILFDEQKLPYEVQCNNCTWKNDELIVSKANATITLTCSIPPGAEGYIRLSGFDINGSGLTNFKVNVACDGVTKTSYAISSLWSYYYGRENYLFNLGYSEEERTELTITFPTKGNFKLDNIELYALPMDNYPKHVEALRAEPMENIKWSTNRLTGTVNLSRDKVLCVSVPYSAGWSATVDGEKAEILRGNYMFMALPLSAGYHEIEFNYCSPGLKVGAVVSVISIAVLVGLLLNNKQSKHRGEKRHEF